MRDGLERLIVLALKGSPQSARNCQLSDKPRLRQQQNEELFHGIHAPQGVYLMGREIPYSPMGKPRKRVSIERMQEILRKHAEPKVEVSRETIPEAPKPVSVPLEWEKPTSRDQTALLTKCGRYSCCKIRLNERVTYECWALVPQLWFRQIAVGLPSFEAAKAIAQKDADAKAAKP